MTQATRKRLAAIACAAAVAALAGCATPHAYDYTALRQARPASILVLPPLNHTPEVGAPAGVLSHVTTPLAESGYYVLPVAVVDEAFRQNGIVTADDAQAAPPEKLREIFGADAALYLDVREYGTVYKVLSSETKVTVEGRLMDLRTGEQLWSGEASASSDEGRSNSGGLIGMLVSAVVNQVADSLSDRSAQMAVIADHRLLASGRPGGLLYGPRSPKYGTD